MFWHKVKYSVFTKKGHYKVNKAEVHLVSNCTIKEILVRKSKNTLMSSSAALLAFDITYTQCGNIRNLHFLRNIRNLHFLRLFFFQKKKNRESNVFQKKEKIVKRWFQLSRTMYSKRVNSSFFYTVLHVMQPSLAM